MVRRALTFEVDIWCHGSKAEKRFSERKHFNEWQCHTEETNEYLNKDHLKKHSI